MAQTQLPHPTPYEKHHTISDLMNPTQVKSREFLEQSIDDEIKSLEESIHVLKLRRNTPQPVSSLPPEIVAAIFSSLCLPGIPSLGGDWCQNHARLNISHVCHQWREIALNQPQLWSHVNFNTVSPVGATEILVRAKSAPLYMEIKDHDYEDGLFGLFLEEVRAHLPYICHLKISSDVFFRSLGYELQHALVSPAPFLEYFSLFCREDEIRSRAVNHLPDIETLRLFGGSTPRLSCLKLHNCNISWKSLLFKGLKHLEILLPHKRARPTLSIWLDALKEIPQLNTLILHSASPIAAHFPIDVECTVTLPSLTLLDISASLQDCALAIAHLVLPALTSLRLAEIHHSLPNRSTVQEFLHYVVRHVHGPQDIQPLQSVLIRNYGSRLQLLAWPVPDIDTFVHDPPSSLGATLPTRVMLSFSSISNDCREIFEIMMATFPLDNLLTLTAVDLDLVGNLTQLWIRLFPIGLCSGACELGLLHHVNS